MTVDLLLVLVVALCSAGKISFVLSSVRSVLATGPIRPVYRRTVQLGPSGEPNKHSSDRFAISYACSFACSTST